MQVCLARIHVLSRRICGACAALALFLPAVALRADEPNLALRRSVEQSMHRANSYYQNNFPLGTAVWNRGAYHVGNFRAWEYLGLGRDLDYAVAWATANSWTRGPEGPAHADAHCAGQVYIDLFRHDPQPLRIANTKSTMDALVGVPAVTDDWWWIDAFFMAGPTFAKLGVTYGDPAYFSQLETMYLHMKNTRQLFDPAHGLWYRDAAAKARTGANTPEFWGRGNGWVIAACARLLEELPPGDPRRPEFEGMLQTMAAALLPWQGTDGFWRSNIKFPGHFSNPETSCTAFFTYAIAYGINAGLLDSATYLPAVMNAWNGMTQTALHPSGKLGYVQAIGLDPKAATFEGDQDYGYGAYLLAGVEILRLLGGPAPVAAIAGAHHVRFDADGDYAETVGLDASDTLIRDGGPATYTWWRGDVFLGQGIQTDVKLPLGDHEITLKVQHDEADPYTASTRVRVDPKSPVQVSASASGFESGNPPAHVLDADLSTRWSHQGVGQWLQLEFPQAVMIDRAMISFYLGDTRLSYFDLAVSLNGTTWEQVFTGQSSGTSTALETFTFPARSARYLRYIGRGNSASTWNSVTGFMLPLVPVASASGFQQGNPPANVVDGNLATRWSHEGIGQWFQLELPSLLTLDQVQIAFFQGDTRFSYFDLEVSTDGSVWEQVLTGQSSGTSNALETFTFPARNARFLRYIGRGNSTSNWNSVTEIRLPLADALDTADLDSDGLPDSWEIHHFGNIGQGTAMQTFYLTGIAPSSSQAPPALRIEPAAAHLRLVLDARAAFGPGYLGKVRKHRILTSPDLSDGSWLPLQGMDIISGDNLSHPFEIDPTPAPAFYRAASWLEETSP